LPLLWGAAMPAELFATVVLLLILLDPLGNVPFIIALLRNLPPERRQRIVLRECLIAGLVLVAFVFMGEWVLATLRLSESALEISGGLILFLIALGMVFPRDPSEGALGAAADSDPLIVPIAMPMIAGPAALATVLLNARQAESPYLLVGAIVIATAVNAVVLLSAGRVARLLGHAGIAATERLMGLVLTTMAVQMLISGVRTAFGLGAGTP
jgi:multiple antibiotic resistance protein